MSWTPHVSIAPSIVTLRAASRSIGGSFRLLGGTVSDVQLRDLFRATLGISDDMDDEAAISTHISATVSGPVALPADLADALTRARVAVDDMALARAIGVDPLRLLMLGHDATASVTAGRMKVRSIPLWSGRSLDRVDVSFTLGKGVTWRRGTLRATNTQLPETMLDSMRGRTLDTIVDHGWDGWKGLRVESASKSGGTLVLATGPQEETSLSGL